MFDGVVIGEAGPPALDRPSLRALAYVLRHPDTWPEGFTWRFAEAGGCAMGLCCRLWQPGISAPWFGGVAALLGVPARVAFALFVDPALWAGRRPATDMAAITPEMVADEVEHVAGLSA